MSRVLLTGATGFVGSATLPALERAGHRVRCATRHPQAARARRPGFEWVALDVSRPMTLEPALDGVEAALYLIHSMGAKGGGGDWAAREREGARAFAEAAQRAGVQRIVYLGGVQPQGTPSPHLASRMRTGAALRRGEVPVVELRAGMIIGPGSASWQIVRDLSMRLPVMVLPAWLQHRTAPVAIADVVAALVHAASDPATTGGTWALDGPEVLTGQRILTRIAALRGLRPLTMRVPFVSPRLSSHWIGWITRADLSLARALVEGLTHDLLAREPSYWPLMGDPPLVPFDDAARAALEAEALPSAATALEWLVQHALPWRHVPRGSH